MQIEYNYHHRKPQFVVSERYLGMIQYTINYSVEDISESENTQEYRYLTVELPPGVRDRGAVISAIIRQRYSDDEMQAIINNYLLDESDAEARQKFQTMQQYRQYAKSIANKFIDEIS